MNRELLEKEFEPSQIKTRKGSYGKTLDYVETAAVIKRLNDATDGDWSFEIVEHLIKDDEVMVLGKLSVDGVVKMQWGTKKIAKDRKTGSVICLGDDLKSAASDSLKKTASLLGVGLHLYTDDALEPAQPVTNKSDEKIRKEQLAQIKKLRTELNWKPNDVQGQAQKMFQTEVTELNPTMADAFIAFLKAQVDAQSENIEAEKPSSDEPPF